MTVFEYTMDIDPLYTQPEKLTDMELYGGAESGFVRTLQYYTEMPEGTFYTLADGFRNPGNDIGWRYAYDFLNLHYCFLTKSGESRPLTDMYPISVCVFFFVLRACLEAYSKVGR